MTKSDDAILELLDESGIKLSPKVIGSNIEVSHSTVRRRLPKLLDAELVDRPEGGLYQITDRGRDYLDGELDAEDLEPETN